MTEQPKRSSRVKKNPKYFHSDIYNTLHPDQMNQKWDFGSVKAPQNNNFVQPVAKVPDSKLLCNFINKVNKSYQEYRSQMAQENMNTVKKETTLKEKKQEVKIEGNKKGNYLSKQRKVQLAKKNKELLKLRNQYINAIQPENKNSFNSQQIIEKIKSAQEQIGLRVNMASMSMNGIHSDSLKKQYDKLQNLYKLNASDHNASNLNQFGNGIQGSSQFISHKTSQKTKKQSQKNNNANSEQRVFKRSAYHVAIAYHIYLKNLKQKNGPNIQNQIDPTYFARRLKQGKTENIGQ